MDDKDKQAQVMAAMGLSGAAPQLQGDLPTDGSGNYAVATGGPDSTLQAPPQASPAPVPVASPQPVAQTPAAPVAPPKAQPEMGGKPDPVALMSKLTDNDSDKLNALLGQLKDSDKRGAFAQALGVIGDTLGNVGQARAGMAPSGFTSTKLLTDQNDTNRGRIGDNIKQQIAADPRSQTSQLAQMSLMQAMNIKPNDPRAKAILAMPAATIVQQVPQLGDSIKLQLERESNALQSQQLESNIKDRDVQLQIASDTQKVQERKNRGDLAANVAEHTSVFNPAHYAAQKAALSGIDNQTAGHGIPDLGSTFNGHKVLKVTRIK